MVEYTYETARKDLAADLRQTCVLLGVAAAVLFFFFRTAILHALHRHETISRRPVEYRIPVVELGSPSTSPQHRGF